MNELADGPDPVWPGAIFRDGTGVATVQVDQVWTPNVFAGDYNVRDGGEEIAKVAIVALRRVWWSLIRDRDERWKVVVMFRPRAFPNVWFTHAIEFFETRDEASVRRRELIANWQALNYAQKPRIGRRQRRRLRLASRGTGAP